MELYKTGVEAPIFRNWTAGTIVAVPPLLLLLKFMPPWLTVKAVLPAVLVSKNSLPRSGCVERCIAGAALVVELYQPAAGDGGVVGATRVEKIHCP